MSCRWDREAEDYLTDDGPCRRDEYGDPTHHCKHRRSCSNHVGKDELTCARCLGRVRTDIRRIRDLAPLMLPVAIGSGVESEAANLAGPAADPRGWSERRIAMGRHLDTWQALARITEKQHEHALAAMPDDDDEHPYSLLTRWQMMLSEDYGHPLPHTLSVTTAADYLDRNLGRIAQDDQQDFPLLGREMRQCRNHLEAVMRNSNAPEKGATCPQCRDEKPDEPAQRLVRSYGHWCNEDDCERLHYLDDAGDLWTCPRNKSHQWDHEYYRKYIDTSRARVRVS